MKFHKEITSKEYPVYDENKAGYIYDKRKVGYRKLSLMKQENIRVALANPKIELITIKNAIRQECGYCFKFVCLNCLLSKKQEHNGCSNNVKNMLRIKTKKEFAKRHKKWCKQIGLWKKEWK